MSQKYLIYPEGNCVYNRALVSLVKILSTQYE